MSVHALALRTIRRHHMVPSGGRLLVALSGGPDSVALLHVLLELQASGELVVSGIAHFNHQLRGVEADGDEEFCRNLASALHLPFVAGRGDVRSRAHTEHRSIEDAARAARYEFLSEAVETLNASAVAVGHTLDDQAETFLLRLIRGAGSRGLAGIRPKAGIVVRPLLEVRRQHLREYAATHQLAYRDDATNADTGIPRNRIRHELIPLLEREYSSGIVQVLAREADSAREDEEKLQADATDLAAAVVLSCRHSDTGDTGPGIIPGLRIAVDAGALAALHPAMAVRVAREALGHLCGGRFIGSEHLHRFLAFAATGTPGSALSLPGQQAIREGARVILGPEPPRGVEDRANSFQFPLSIPGEVVLGPQGFRVLADWGDVDRRPDGELACSVSGVRLPLAVRSRKPGDRFQPPGMGGKSRKLQDYLVDRKVNRSDRDRLPLVVDGEDRIVWIVGHAVGESFRVTAPSHGVISLKARRLGGEG
ncbi:MAG: tRNA lysidine(34) synthetase TilS [Vicinamibacterales bacterium]